MSMDLAADHGIWVDDYVTSTGVHISGHWRRRSSGARGGPAPGDVTGASSGTATPATGSHSPGDGTPAPVAAAGSARSAEHDHPEGGPHGQLATAQARLKQTQVQLGLLALHSSTEQSQPHRAQLLARRDEARRELHLAQGVVDQATQDDHPPNTDNGFGRQCPSCGQFAGDNHTCPAPEGLPPGDYSKTSRDARTKEMLADLETSVAAIVESGQLTRWLDAMSSNGMSRWSMNNRLLSALQMFQRGEDINDLHLMGFRQWEKFNRRVRRGEKAVWILAPMTRKIRETGDDGEGVEKVRVVGFKSVPVFDASQTDGDPLPEAPIAPAPGEATTGTLDGLRERVTTAGYTYEETQIPDCQPETGKGTLGYTDPATKRIVVDSRLNSAQKASTIAHELGHVHCGHVDGDYNEYRRHRGRFETEAEMTAALVSRSRGASREQVEAFSPGYIASWSKGDPAVMHAAADRAVRAHNKIMDGDWPPGGSR